MKDRQRNMQTEKRQKQGADTVMVGSPAPSAAVGSCVWMKNEAKDSNFMTNLKHRFSGFIHAPTQGLFQDNNGKGNYFSAPKNPLI